MLDALHHDILICVFTALTIPEILVLRQASRRLYLASGQHAVWKTACTNEILQHGIPFPNRPLSSFSAKDLERATLRAYTLGLNWGSPTTTLRHVASVPSHVGSIEQIRFLSRRGQSWMVTTSLAIWWALSVWDCHAFHVVAQWDPGKALFNGIAVNTDDRSDSAIALSVRRDARTMVEILALVDDAACGVRIEHRRTLDTPHKPIALHGDLVALCDHDSETVILNWKTEEQAVLKSPDTWQDKPLEVVLTQGSVLVVRARSICVFERPRMVLPGGGLDVVLPCAYRSLGWVDGVSLASGPFPIHASHTPLSLLVRKKGDDPWRLTEEFQFMRWSTDRGASHDTPLERDAVSFPFDLVASLTSPHRGLLRCSDMVLGSYGTAVWVQPSDWAPAGLIADDRVVTRSYERLVVALFPGAFHRGSSDAQIKVVLENEKESGWLCLDYDEARGMIALGSSLGEVTVYRL